MHTYLGYIPLVSKEWWDAGGDVTIADVPTSTHFFFSPLGGSFLEGVVLFLFTTVCSPFQVI